MKLHETVNFNIFLWIFHKIKKYIQYIQNVLENTHKHTHKHIYNKYKYNIIYTNIIYI